MPSPPPPSSEAARAAATVVGISRRQARPAASLTPPEVSDRTFRPFRHSHSLPVPRSQPVRRRRMYYRPFPSVTSLSSECEDGDDSSSSSADECEGSIGRRPTRRQRSLSLGTDSFPRFRTNDGGGAAEIPLDVEDGLCLSVSPITPSTADLVIRGEGDLVTRAKASTEGPAETSPLLHHPASALVSLHHPAPPLVSPKFPAHLPTPEKYKVHRRMSSIISSVCKPLLYGGVNCVMCIPCLYGYAAIIFRHPAYAGSVTALTKLALLSSMVHQLSFSFCSTLPFAIGQVQDAGLLFLSAMASDIADHVSSMTLEGTDPTPAIISTAVVLLGLATASLGAALMAAGRLRLADAVSYLPLPVVGGYLAFIGYFCLQAGVGLCASEDMVTVSDWGKVVNVRDVGLVLPGLIGGVVMTLSARLMPDALPAVMVGVPASFYLILYVTNTSMEVAREGGWVGEISSSVGPMDVFGLIDYRLVHWDAIPVIAATWVGMVFVVSFSSCLDVAAIAIDMGEALETNKELIVVGVSNLISGLTCGFTGSYIFSSTIFTYRTGTTNRAVGLVVAGAELAVFLSTANFLQFTPLYFLGGTLIFIGFDLVYEWIVEIRHKLLLSEYIVLLLTFLAIHIFGMDFGVILGVGVAIVDYVISTSRVSSLSRVSRRSRAVWTPQQWKMLQNHGYHGENPQIVTFEVQGTVFFGSSLQLLEQLSASLQIRASEEERERVAVMASPRMVRPRSPKPQASARVRPATQRRKEEMRKKHSAVRRKHRSRPHFVVLDLHSMIHVDASASRACFLQLAKMCAKRGICVCASGANSRVDWMLRSHDVAYSIEEEDAVRAEMYAEGMKTAREHLDSTKVLLFENVYEALEFCEHKIIDKLERDGIYGTASAPCDPVAPSNGGSSAFRRIPSLTSLRGTPSSTAPAASIADVLAHYLGPDAGHRTREALEAVRHGGGVESIHAERTYRLGDIVCDRDSEADAFFVVLAGSVCVCSYDDHLFAAGAGKEGEFVTGGGKVRALTGGSVASLDGSLTEIILQVGNIFGFVDYMLERRRACSYIAAADGTVLAILSRATMERLRSQQPDLERLLEKVLLQASIRELANVSPP